MWGTKKVLVKIINGRLIIRVGGGFMSVEEFVQQKTKIEMMKVLKLDEHRDNKKNSGIRLDNDVKKSGFRDETKQSIMNNINQNMPYDILKIVKKQ